MFLVGNLFFAAEEHTADPDLTKPDLSCWMDPRLVRPGLLF